MDHWDAWIGRGETRHDRVDPGMVARLCATLDRAVPPGTAPQGAHWCLCLPDAPTALLGADGHPRRDGDTAGFLPPIPLPRRMWAGSTVRFHAPLPLDARVTRSSHLAAIRERQGGSGRLVFVDIVHETHTDETLLVSETQSVVYREAAPASAPLAPPPLGQGVFDAGAWTLTRRIDPSPPLLFRYSALTFNSHRIHYDLPYATGEEGYRGLVVHGPLTATLLLDLAARHWGDDALADFTFRGTSPAIAGEPLHLALREDGTMAAFADDGRQVVEAAATLR